jgi:hypothetical protein
MIESETPAATEPATPAAKPRQSVRLGVADMAMYVAIVGKAPEIGEAPTEPKAQLAEARRENPLWSPIVLSIYLKQIYRQSTLRLNKPEIAAWMKRQSNIAMKRIHETQLRLAHLKNDRAA